MLLRRNLVLCRNCTPKSRAYTCCIYPMALEPLGYHTSPCCRGAGCWDSHWGSRPTPEPPLCPRTVPSTTGYVLCPVTPSQQLQSTAHVNLVVSQCCWCSLRNSLTRTAPFLGAQEVKYCCTEALTEHSVHIWSYQGSDASLPWVNGERQCCSRWGFGLKGNKYLDIILLD